MGGDQNGRSCCEQRARPTPNDNTSPPSPVAPRRWSRRLPFAVAIACVVAACAGASRTERSQESAGEASPTSASTMTPGTTSQPPADPTPVHKADSTSTVISTEPEDAAKTCIDSLSVRRKAALLVWPTVAADDWASAVRVVRDVGVGGVLLLRPRLTERQLIDKIGELDEASQRGVLIATDEEGGAVQRLSDIKRLPSQRDMSRLLTPTEAEPVVAEHALLVARLGIDVVLGPVVDVAPTDGAPALQRSRFFDGDERSVSRYARAYVTGWESAGLTPTIKHFPGHGSASGDTHVGDGVTPDLSLLTGRDLVPYRRLAALQPAVLVGHLIVPGLTEGRPATASTAAIAYLRNELGYRDALVISDALDMAGAAGPAPAAAVEAIGAGIDVVLGVGTGDVDSVIDNVVEAVNVGRIPDRRLDEAGERVLQQLGRRGAGCAASGGR